MNKSIRLTQTVKKGGCAAKVAASELRKILSQVPFPVAPAELTIDGRHFDDAAVYRINGGVAMVQTIDFFTPIVDRPFDFGRVAAANAISDVYAMGGRPVMALAVLAFPLGELPNEVVTEILSGACAVLTKAKAALAGGHSIDDDTLKFGLSVTGLVHPERVWSNAGARPGNVLILTKGLGTGTITAAVKRDAVNEGEIQYAIESMAMLNNAIDYLDSEEIAAVNAATDVTGFGFSGHAMQMAKASGVNFAIQMKNLPRLERAEEFLTKEFLTKAHRTNREYTAAACVFSDSLKLNPVEQLLIHDPQTSGGLLLSVAPSHALKILEKLRLAFPMAAIVGEVRAAHGKPGILEFS
jgi:selenide,water dikinase